MGRVLLAGLPDDELDAYLEKLDIQRLTERTITARDELKAAILAVRADGICVLDQELEAGLRSMAAPIRNASGLTVAAVNISTPAARYSLEDLHSDLIPRCGSPQPTSNRTSHRQPLTVARNLHERPFHA